MNSMFRISIAVATALLFAPLASAQTPSTPPAESPAAATPAAQAFSGDQRHEIEGIVKDYLVSHPEVLQEAMVEIEAEGLRCVFELVLIRRDVVRRMELNAHEDLRGDRDALLRQVRRDRVDPHELGRQAIGPREPRRNPRRRPARG